EVKISGFHLSVAMRTIWPGSLCQMSAHDNGRGGVVTLLSPDLSSNIISWGSDPTHRV
ncbi:hypothetical protein KI387_027278, partial [Taxus chinensis]